MYKRYQPVSLSQPSGTGRTIGGLVFIAFFMLALLARVAYLQIIEHQKYATLSHRNQVRINGIPPSRGLIYDREGHLLAKNIPAFHLAVIPEQTKQLDKLLDNLHDIIPLIPEQRQAFLTRVKHSPAHQRQIIKFKLTEEEVSRFAVNQYRLPGVHLIADLIREYPHGPLFGHILGYVSEANQEELQNIDKKRYAGTYQLGKIGLEKYYENTLQGEPGYQQMETDVRGREVRVMSSYPATSGTDLHLTLSLPLQIAATQALGENKGAVVALDPRNGEVLALVSTPSFDPNQFVRGIDQASYQLLRNAPSRPLFNRAIQGQYPPASTIKPIFGLAGLVSGKIQPSHKILDPGWYQLKGNARPYRDWVKQGHGWTDLEKSIRESCDVYYYILAEKLTIQPLSNWMSAVGLGKATGIDLPGEQKGLVPSPAWKKSAMGTSWYPGETLITGIGQGYTLATPLQLAVLTSYLANKGEAFKPHLNQNMVPQKLPSLKLEHPHYWSHVIEPMHQVVQHPRGTAYRFFTGFPVEAAGKTGTAQVFGLKINEKYNHDGLASHLRDHSLFIGFAPLQEPTIVVAVILENQKASARVAREVMQAYLHPTPETQQEEQNAL